MSEVGLALKPYSFTLVFQPIYLIGLDKGKFLHCAGHGDVTEIALLLDFLLGLGVLAEELRVEDEYSRPFFAFSPVDSGQVNVCWPVGLVVWVRVEFGEVFLYVVYVFAGFGEGGKHGELLVNCSFATGVFGELAFFPFLQPRDKLVGGKVFLGDALYHLDEAFANVLAGDFYCAAVDEELKGEFHERGVVAAKDRFGDLGQGQGGGV